MSTLINIHNYVKEEYEEIENPSVDTQFYLTRFSAHPNKRRFISWNWSAFLFPLYWFAYRKMYLQSLLYYVSVFMAFFIALVLINVVGYLIGFVTDMTPIPVTTIYLTYLLVELSIRIFLGFYGNSIYLNNLKQRIYSKSKRRGTSGSAVLLAITLNYTVYILTFFL